MGNVLCISYIYDVKGVSVLLYCVGLCRYFGIFDLPCLKQAGTSLDYL